MKKHETTCSMLRMSLKLMEVFAKLENVEANLKKEIDELKEQVMARDKVIKQLKTKVKSQKKSFSEEINRLSNDMIALETNCGQEVDSALIRVELIKRQQCEEMRNFRAYIAIKEKDIVMGAYNANLYSVLENIA
jgi:predicted RNase H-like nuclease (RuvC/YqgF family)